MMQSLFILAIVATATAQTASTYNDPVISNGFYCGHGASGAVAGWRPLRTFNGNEEQCKIECGNDVECMVFTMPISNADYECRGSPSGSGPCCYLIYVDNAPRVAPSNAICPNSAGGYARAANSYRLWAKKTQGQKFVVPSSCVSSRGDCARSIDGNDGTFSWMTASHTCAPSDLSWSVADPASISGIELRTTTDLGGAGSQTCLKFKVSVDGKRVQIRSGTIDSASQTFTSGGDWDFQNFYPRSSLSEIRWDAVRGSNVVITFANCNDACYVHWPISKVRFFTGGAAATSLTPSPSTSVLLTPSPSGVTSSPQYGSEAHWAASNALAGGDSCTWSAGNQVALAMAAKNFIQIDLERDHTIDTVRGLDVSNLWQHALYDNFRLGTADIYVCRTAGSGLTAGDCTKCDGAISNTVGSYYDRACGGLKGRYVRVEFLASKGLSANIHFCRLRIFGREIPASTYNAPVISNGFYCGHGASGAVAGWRPLRTFNGNEEQCKTECGNDVECMVFTMPISNADYECRGSPTGSGPCCYLIYVDNAPREAPSNTICPNSAGGYARAPNSYRLWAKKTQGSTTTVEPTQTPTVEPTQTPTVEPTQTPTDVPTVHPSAEPTQVPTDVPTAQPTRSPTDEPSANPTRAPTSSPTLHPSSSPSLNPTTTQPSQNPTMYSDGVLLQNGCPSDYPERYPGTNRCFGHVWGDFGCNIDPKHDPASHHASDRRCVYSDFVYVKTSHTNVPEWMRQYLTDTIQRKVAQYMYEYVRCANSDGSYEDFYTFVNEAQRQSFEGNNDWFIQFPGMKDMWDASGVVQSSSIDIHRDEYMPNYESCTKVVPLGGTRTGNGCPSRIPLRYPGTDRCFETMWKGESCNVNAKQTADPVCQYEEDRHLGAAIVDYFTNVQC